MWCKMLIQVVAILCIVLSSPTFALHRLSLLNLLLCGSSNNGYSVQAASVVTITLIYLSSRIIIQNLKILHTITNNSFTYVKKNKYSCLPSIIRKTTVTLLKICVWERGNKFLTELNRSGICCVSKNSFLPSKNSCSSGKFPDANLIYIRLNNVFSDFLLF